MKIGYDIVERNQLSFEHCPWKTAPEAHLIPPFSK
jgi:hypothetical protein